MQPAPVPIYRGAGGLYEHAVRELVRDSARWAAIWDSTGGADGDQPEPPAVDFSRSMLVAAIGPPSPNPSDSLLLRNIVDQDGVVRGVVFIYYVCSPAPMSSLPIEIVAIRRSNSKLRLAERRVNGPACQFSPQ